MKTTKVFLSLLLLIVVLIMNGCESPEVMSEVEGSYLTLKEHVEYGDIDLEVDSLNGEIIYSFEPADNQYSFDYNLRLQEGDFKLEVITGGEKVDEVPWMRDDEKELNEKHDDGHYRIHGYGGVFRINEVKERVYFFLHGRDSATGMLEITW
ncbi:hypothetical protein LGQ02_01140 [Bacillus shivajii]|uniref:hypothetical protein n=1 Tax=Bacillus shivajii TaxID=1983719 RepID=UPI001CFB7E80|nr:hypothetical protein [Bacillus shivajii]UCZ53435.1 hypothetical protein LGQ02_01140 [Bacillus shivajii]